MGPRERRRWGVRRGEAPRLIMTTDKKIRVAHRRPRVRRRVHPDLPAAPERRDVRHLPPRQERARRVRRPVRDREALHQLRRAARATRTSTPSTSTRRSRITRRSRSPRSRPASTSPAPCRWRRRSTSAAQIVESQRKSGTVYMMMETVVYSREYLFVKELYDKGELGRIQFLRGSHQQDMDGWPGYWEGLPPMHYATHCVSPCLALARQARRARRLPRLRPDPRGPDPEVRQPVRDRDGDLQAPRLGRLAPRSRAACSTPRGSTARASTSTDRRSHSSGSRSRTRSRSSTPRARRLRRSPRRRSRSG